MIEFAADHVIVGGGTAGCVLAERLSRDPRSQILLIEAGEDTPPETTPADILDVYPSSQGNLAYYWPDLAIDPNLPQPVGPSQHQPIWRFSQARVMGGGGSVMGMIALRGVPADYDAWHDAGCTGWGWTDVLPVFRRIEADQDFDGPVHGNDGAIPIRRVRADAWPPFLAAAAGALAKLGETRVEDMNSGVACGFGPTPKSMTATHRVSSAQAYLGAEVRRRANLTIVTRAPVVAIDWQGKDVAGITFGGPVPGRARAPSVILSAGTIHSPALLMRAGIGPAKALCELGIAVRADLPGVGRNLQNHPMLTVAAHLLRSARQPAAMREMCSLWSRFSSDLPDAPAADLCLNVLAATGPSAPFRTIGSVGTSLYKPFSTGEVHLQTADPRTSPAIRFDLLHDPRDLVRMAGAFARCLTLLEHPAVRAQRHEMFLPNPTALGCLNGSARAMRLAEAALELGWLRRRLLRHARIDPAQLLRNEAELRDVMLQVTGMGGHVTGTCRMGDPARSDVVVDPDCRVKGVSGLRVIDASIMPGIVAANTNLTVQMMAELAADRLLASSTWSSRHALSA